MKRWVWAAVGAVLGLRPGRETRSDEAMTEAEWLACSDPMRLHTPGSASMRKRRLFGVACCRHLLRLTPDAAKENAAEMSELFADGVLDARELVARFGEKDALSVILGYDSSLMLQYAIAFPTEWSIQADLHRDIFGNPFRPVTFSTSWRTSTVLGLAQAIYDERAFDRLPILADALEEAGCNDASVLGHCRGLGPHVRGCWAVDQVLGKS